MHIEKVNFNNDSTELQVKTVTRPLWAPDASESTGKGGDAVLAG